MKKHTIAVWFSCGAASAVAAKKTIAFDMFIQGYSYRQIEDEIGISKSSAQRYVESVLNEGLMERLTKSDEYIQLEVERMDFVLKSLMKDLQTSIQLDFIEEEGKRKRVVVQVDRTDHQIANTILKLMERRSKLLGLDKKDGKEDGNFSLEDLILAAMQPKLIGAKVIDVEVVEKKPKASKKRTKATKKKDKDDK